MNEKRLFLFLLILPLVVGISGCTIPGLTLPGGALFPDSVTPEGTGILIESFETDLPTVMTNEEVAFKLKMKNTGSEKAESVFAELLGLDNNWQDATGISKSSSGEVFPDEEKCRYTSKSMSLLPPDPSSGTGGGEEVCTWRYRAPDLPPGITTTSKPRARVFYSYTSSTIKSVTLVSKEEFNSLKNQGKSPPMGSVTKTSSPVSIGIEATNPIRLIENTVVFPIIIKVENIGGGTVCASIDSCKKFDAGGSKWDELDIKITQNGMTLEQCQPTEKIFLVGGKSQTISCMLKANLIDDEVDITQKNIEVKATYGYFIEKSTTVSVGHS